VGVLALCCLLLPLAGALLLSLLPLPRTASGLVGAGSVLLAFLCAVGLALAHAGLGTYPFSHAGALVRGTDVRLGTWLSAAGLRIPLGLWVDGLSAVFVLVITGVGFLIHVYSLAYMAGEEPRDYARYFAGMNLFVGAMLLLVLADSFPLLLVGWAGVGFASYLLIGFWHERPAAVQAAREAFVLNTVGDAALIVAIALLVGATGHAGFASVLGPSGLAALRAHARAAGAAGLLLFVAAAAKSAQLPLQSWLSDAMEGPTPVSALIHAATMVTAGVYLIARCLPIYTAAPGAAAVAGLLGAVTAFGAATVGVFSYDIKRLLAYSTMSQIGYMIAGVSFGAIAAGVSHVVMHAFLKALLFMSVGVVMHATGDERDMRRYGGLARVLPLARWSFLAGALALAGIPPFAGFWSKDAVMGALLSGGHLAAYLLLAAAALLTPFYIFRAYYLTFGGPHRGPGTPHAPASAALDWPMAVLAVLSVCGGAFAVLLQAAWGARLDVTSMAISTVLALAGWLSAWRIYRAGDIAADAWTGGRLGDVVRGEYGWVGLWRRVLVEPGHALAAWLQGAWEGAARPAAEGAVAAAAGGLGRFLSGWQSGLLRRYALSMACGAALVVLWALAAGR
jgi:NADH-quinone oxidoreductase subunit L